MGLNHSWEVGFRHLEGKNQSKSHSPTHVGCPAERSSALGGDPLLIARAGRREGENQPLYRNLNKQEINIHHFYKLQHYGTVECINYTGERESTVFTLKRFRKGDFFGSSFYFFDKLYKSDRRGKEIHCTQMSGSDDERNTLPYSNKYSGIYSPGEEEKR